MLPKLACVAALALYMQLAQAAPGVAAANPGIGQDILAVNLTDAPATSAATPQLAPQQATSDDETPGIDFAKGMGDTYLIGAALGILDVAGLHRLDHPVQQDTSGIWSIGKSPQFPAELIGPPWPARSGRAGTRASAKHCGRASTLRPWPASRPRR